ncbi:MAG: KR domain-containing protein [Deltaproteobacteria bacterium]|nr:KR domain-containing protein [Deltaproteobacteria bacterium]
MSDRSGLEIAVVGMSGRFPGAENIEKFWQNLRDGVESVKTFSDQELLASGVDPAVLDNPDYVKSAAVLEGVDLFDAAFFGYSGTEAELMDPQQRFFLECAWKTLEDAGYDTSNYKGLIGVCAGVSVNTYLLNNLRERHDIMEPGMGFQTVLGNDKDFLATRVSYKLNLEGPSIVVQTACSTSLVAIHVACQGLLSGECDIALAGGVLIKIPQQAGYFYQEGGIFSPDGHCRAFDASARGFFPGSGVGVVALKRLEDALADGDSIHAVIKGSAINNDGSFKVGFTAPSVAGQAKVIQAAQSVAGAAPETISYIETHGTGTALGDPIEVAALTQAFRAGTEARGFCAIGSVKTNIGHLDAAAGVAGFIKTVLSLKHRLLPPSLNFEKPNPQIDFDKTPFYVNAKLSSWPQGSGPRRAGVSGFGIGGTNAHVILEEAPPARRAESRRRWHLLVLSAKSEKALNQATANLAARLRKDRDLYLPDVAYTLQVGRRAFSHRRMVVCQNLADAADALETSDPKRVITSVYKSDTPSVVFMFPGQGAQYLNMTSELYETEPYFREQVDQCADILNSHLGFDLRSVLYPDVAESEEAARRLNQTDVTQPALFVVEYALAQLWMKWGVQPQAMIGHSIGEYAAACLAGVFSLEDGLALMSARGELMNRAPHGAMLAVSMPLEKLRYCLGEELRIAAANAPSLGVVSGPTDAVLALEARLTEEGVACRRLNTSHAFHSAMMDSVADAFAARIRQINLKPPRLPYISNLSGTWITPSEATAPSYWAKHLRNTVQFSAGLQELTKQPGRLFLEVGPGQTLTALVNREATERPGPLVLSSTRGPSEKQSDSALLLSSLGRLWLAGVPVEWSGIYATERRRRVSLPSYPFDRQRYWIDPPSEQVNGKIAERSLRRKADIADWFYAPSWKRSAAPREARQKTSPNKNSPCLIFADQGGLGSRLALRLEERGYRVITVRAGKEFTRISRRDYIISPRKREDYNGLLADLRLANKTPSAILHLWNVGLEDRSSSETALAEAHLDSGFYSLLFLGQAWGNQNPWESLSLFVLTSGVQEITGEESLYPEKAAVLGPCKVIPQEYPNISCRSIDIAPPAPETAEEQRLIEDLITELTAEPSDGSIAYRGKHRWVQIFEPVRLERRLDGTISLREEGVYLITGGLGGLGLVLAQSLAEKAKAKLILTGRTAFPRRELWQQWLQSPEGEHALDDKGKETREKIRKLVALERMGAQILALKADVTNLEEMSLCIQQARDRFGTIHGVVHAAGVLHDGIIQLKEPEVAASVLAPKVKGSRVLETVFRDAELDFLLLFSSVRSLVGGKGLVDYCAANAFLDAFAHDQFRRTGRLTASINWGVWREDGMSVKVGAKIGQRSAEALSLETGMSSQEGIEVFYRVLDSGLPEVVVSTQDFNAVMREYTVSKPAESSGQAGSSDAVQIRPVEADPRVAGNTPIEQTLSEIWQALLGIERVGIHDNFFELGGDSLIGLQFIARAHKAGLRFTNKELFDHQTIAELAALAAGKRSYGAEHGPVSGLVPLTPVQRWFFEHARSDAHHWNMAFFFEAAEALDPSLLEKTVQALVAHHDALRLRFIQEDSGWRQMHGDLNHVSPFSCFDLSSLPLEEQIPALQQSAARLQAGINLSEGPLLRIVYFASGSGARSRLLIICHHLVVDLGSWRILLEDFCDTYQRLRRGEKICLPPKTHSLKQWGERLMEFARSEALEREMDYWLEIGNSVPPPLPVDYSGGANTVASARTVSVSLAREETRALLQEVQKSYNARMDDILLMAAGRVLARWAGSSAVLIDQENDGREVEIEGLDVSRTVGWFTVLYPVRLDFRAGDNPGEALKSVKEQLRRVPNHGIGYGLLRYMAEDRVTQRFQAQPRPEVIFLYMGQFDQSLPLSSILKLDTQSCGPTRSPRGMRTHLLEITGSLGGSAGELQFDWTFSENIHRRSTIENLAHEALEVLRSLIAHSGSQPITPYTPSDFRGARLSQSELDRFIGAISQAGSQRAK